MYVCAREWVTDYGTLWNACDTVYAATTMKCRQCSHIDSAHVWLFLATLSFVYLTQGNRSKRTKFGDSMNLSMEVHRPSRLSVQLERAPPHNFSCNIYSHICGYSSLPWNGQWNRDILWASDISHRASAAHEHLDSWWSWWFANLFAVAVDFFGGILDFQFSKVFLSVLVCPSVPPQTSSGPRSTEIVLKTQKLCAMKENCIS